MVGYVRFSIYVWIERAYIYDILSNENAIQKLSILSEVVILIFSLTVLVYGGINITSLTMKQISAALGVSMGYVYMVLPLSGVLMIFYGVNNILNIIKEKNNVETKQIKKFS